MGCCCKPAPLHGTSLRLSGDVSSRAQAPCPDPDPGPGARARAGLPEAVRPGRAAALRRLVPAVRRGRRAAAVAQRARAAGGAAQQRRRRAARVRPARRRPGGQRRPARRPWGCAGPRAALTAEASWFMVSEAPTGSPGTFRLWAAEWDIARSAHMRVASLVGLEISGRLTGAARAGGGPGRCCGCWTTR
jgi:type II secretory pathway pseudopilin PulG